MAREILINTVEGSELNDLEKIATILEKKNDILYDNTSPLNALERIANALGKQAEIDLPSALNELAKIALALENDKGDKPTGEIDINNNGVFDVTNYASANVNVSAELDETLLWENLSPDTVMTATTNLNINENTVKGYKYLKFICKSYISQNEPLWEILVPTDIFDFTKGNYWGCCALSTTYGSTNTQYTRQVWIRNNDIQIGQCYKGGTTTASASYTIVLSVYGVGKQ